MLNRARRIVLLVYAILMVVLGFFFVPKFQLLSGRVYVPLWESGILYKKDLTIELLCVTVIMGIVFWMVGERSK